MLPHADYRFIDPRPIDPVLGRTDYYSFVSTVPEPDTLSIIDILQAALEDMTPPALPTILITAPSVYPNTDASLIEFVRNHRDVALYKPVIQSLPRPVITRPSRVIRQPGGRQGCNRL